VAVWQKWLHPHRLGLLLQHDAPLPRYLHQANPSGRFQQVQCRQAASALFAMLKSWSSFVLIENHTYVKLIFKYISNNRNWLNFVLICGIFSDNEKVPNSFMLLRVTSKLPCLIMNLAFLGGASGALRFKVLISLRGYPVVNILLDYLVAKTQ
jgi:KICSTOR complex protein SZT2